MSEITTGEAMARSAGNAEAVALNAFIDERNETAKLNDKSRAKDLNPVDAEVKIKEITSDPDIRKNLIDLVKLCDGGVGLTAAERQKMIDSFSADLGTIKLFQALQGLQPGRFGILGNPADPACIGYINELLANPDFTKLVKEKISGVLTTEKIDDADIVKLEKDKSDIEAELIKRETEDTKNTTEITSIEAEIAEYNTKEDPKSQTHEPIGKYAREIRQLERDNLGLKNKLEHLQVTKDLIQAYLNYPAGRYPLAIDLPSGNMSFNAKADLQAWIPGNEYRSFIDEISSTKNKFDDNEYRIKQRKEDKVQFEKDLQEKKKKQESYPGEKDALEKKLKDKKEELDGKKKSFDEKKKEISETLKNVLGDSYSEMFIKMNTMAGEWQGEQIKTGEQLMEKRAHEYQIARYITDEGKIRKDLLKEDFNLIKEARPGEGIAEFGAQELASLYSDPLMGPGVRNFLDSVAEFEPDPNLPGNFRIKIDANTGKRNILNEEKFNNLSTKLTGEMLALQVAKNPNKLRDIFSKDEVLARVFSGDVLPKIIEQAFKENKYAKGLPGFENITKASLGEVSKDALTKICETISNHKLMFFMAILVGLGIFLKSK